MRNESAPKLQNGARNESAPKLHKSTSSHQMQMITTKGSPKKIPIKAYDSRDRLNKSQMSQIKKNDSISTLTNLTNLNFSSPTERRTKKVRNCSSKNRMTSQAEIPEYDTQDAKNFLEQLSKENV